MSVFLTVTIGERGAITECAGHDGNPFAIDQFDPECAANFGDLHLVSAKVFSVGGELTFQTQTPSIDRRCCWVNGWGGGWGDRVAGEHTVVQFKDTGLIDRIDHHKPGEPPNHIRQEERFPEIMTDVNFHQVSVCYHILIFEDQPSSSNPRRCAIIGVDPINPIQQYIWHDGCFSSQ